MSTRGCGTRVRIDGSVILLAAASLVPLLLSPSFLSAQSVAGRADRILDVASGEVASTPAPASSRWSIRLEGGRAEIHRAASTGWIIGATLVRTFDEGWLRLEAPVAISAADEDFVTVGAGPGVDLLPGSPVAPVLAAHAGLLAEPEFAGVYATVSAGLVVRPIRGVSLRGVVQRGTHGGSSGPHAITVGVEVSFGRGS